MTDFREAASLDVTKDGQFAYRIYLEDSFRNLPLRIRELSPEGRRLVVVTDSNVEKLYAEEVLTLLRPVCADVSLFVIPAGEEHKKLDEIRRIYVHLIEHHLDRKDLLIALGGGVVGDMTGFAAATYLRGIRFVQIPTTLLSQVDSSIGGKTGVDFESYKNMVGAFHQPSLVYSNIGALLTLDNSQFASGMGEVLKHGIIRSSAYYEYLLDHMEQIESRDLTVMKAVVAGSCAIKRSVVESDPQEKGERAILNFGHTLGHAIEKMKNFTLPHGHCVALGCVTAAYISWQRGYIDSDTFYEIRDMFVGFGLPISYDSLNADDIIDATRHDKKMDQGHIRFILIHELGDAFIAPDVTEEEMRRALNFIDADAHAAD